MGLEVELKAHVLDPLLLRQRIESLAGISPAMRERKEDTYFSRKGEDALFRMRLEQGGQGFASMQGSLTFTYKNKTLKDGIEANEELEFNSASDQAPRALQFFLGLGYGIYITKTKEGYVYSYPADPDLPLLTIELVEVGGLGWFMEMEFVLEEASMMDKAKATLLRVLDELGIEHSAIEDRYYMHLLKEKKPEA